MRITSPSNQQTQSGFALIIVLSFLIVSLIVFASVMYWVNGNANVTKRNILFTQSEAAAESATENVISTMMRDFNNQCLNPVNNYTSLSVPATNWPISYQFSDGSTNTVSVTIGPTNWTTLPSQFTGLSGLGQNCVIACTATPLNQGVSLSATVSQTVWFGTIPVFQYAVFYNMDLEINPGAGFTIGGRVHSNKNIYSTGDGPGTNLLVFMAAVDAAGSVSNTPSPADPQNGPSGGNRSGNVVYPSGSPVANYDTLSLPLGNSFTNYSYSAIESLLQMPTNTYALGTAAAYTTNGLNYFANEADLIITNDPATGTNITVTYQNRYNSPNYLIKVSPDMTNSIATVYSYAYSTNNVTHKVTTTTNTVTQGYTNYYYSYVTNVNFYDYRESDTVKAIQIDVGKLGKWLGNTNLMGGWQYELRNASGTSTDIGHVINSIFVYNSVPLTSSQLPAVRIVDGAQLPTNTVPDSNSSTGRYRASGLGIATAMPIYVEDDYNVTTDGVHYAYSLGATTNGGSLPAAFYADAITILSSSNFVDNPAGGTEDPSAVGDTTINAACFEGIVPSNTNYYSGGLENFLRLLENWGGRTLTYNGSIVVMFPSVYATSHWGGSPAYYNPPIRNWGFDATFAQPGGLPPMCPSIKGDARSAWNYW